MRQCESVWECVGVCGSVWECVRVCGSVWERECKRGAECGAVAAHAIPNAQFFFFFSALGLLLGCWAYVDVRKRKET